MALTEKQKRHLKKLAHPLKPVVLIGGAGLSEGVVNEIDSSLAHHELIKVRVNAEDREARDAMIGEIEVKTRAELVQRIGHIAVFFRRADKPRITLP